MRLALATGILGVALGLGAGRAGRAIPAHAEAAQPAPDRRTTPAPTRSSWPAPPPIAGIAPAAPAGDPDAERLRVPWPEELPAGEVAPDAFPALADAVAGACGGRAVLVDCDAYPCVAVVEDVDPACPMPPGAAGLVEAEVPCGGDDPIAIQILVGELGAVTEGEADSWFAAARAAGRRVDDVVLQSLDRCPALE